MLVHLPGGTALHLQQLRPAIVFICLFIIFDVLQEKRERKDEGRGCKFATWQKLQLGLAWGIMALVLVFCRQMGEM